MLTLKRIVLLCMATCLTVTDTTSLHSQIQAPGTGSGGCATGPASTGTAGSFAYVGRGTTDVNGNALCFSAGSGDWQTISTEYGTFRMQTLADQWPDGESYDSGDGSENFTINQYDGYRRIVDYDTVSLSELDPMGRVARSSAPAVVEVFGDRCLQGPTEWTDGMWRISTAPTTGFFVSNDVIVTSAKATKKLTFEEDKGKWGADGYLVSQLSCSEYAAQMGGTWEEGQGPFIRLFDDRWASGTVVASDSNIAVIKLTAVTSNGNTLANTWAPWTDASIPGDPLPFAPSGAASGSVLAIHHPFDGRRTGGWHLTVGPVVSCDKLSSQMPGNRFAVDLYTDNGSVGGPILDGQGFVLGVITDEASTGHPDVCKEDIYRGRNTLGILSSFLAAPPSMTGVIPVDEFRTLVLANTTGTANAPASTAPAWPANALTLDQARFEVVDWGDQFTASGFPKTGLDSDAFDIARQATVMFTRQAGCAVCEENARNNDFSVTCLCTGVAITNHLIMTNNHCVAELDVGQEATFRTYEGQDVNAVLIGKSSIDGNPNDINGREYDPVERGDVALFRTTQRMALTPARLANSDLLRQYDPVLSVGHPAAMSRSGPFVTTAGSFVSEDPLYEGMQYYILPVSGGSSGSGIFNLQGELIGQLQGGGVYSSGERTTILRTKYGRRALEINTDILNVELNPEPFEVSPYVPIATGIMTLGAPSNYIRTLVERWAPGELAATDNAPSVLADPPASVTISGQVTNLVTGQPVSHAAVTIANNTATTDTDGRYSLVAQAPGIGRDGFTFIDQTRAYDATYSHPRFGIIADGYYPRESWLSLTGATTVNASVIPMSDGFDLTFFDHVFRKGHLGHQGTIRWTQQPTIEIWTQTFRCAGSCTDGSVHYEATEDAAPAHFEEHARYAAAQMSALTGGAYSNPEIITTSHAPGTKVNGDGSPYDSPAEYGQNIRFMYVDTFPSPHSTNGGATDRKTSGQAIIDALVTINASQSPSTSNAIYVHEFAHTLGFSHPDGVPAVPRPSIMGPDPIVVTDADRLHGAILYSRPPGSLTADEDPVTAIITDSR